MQLFQHLLAIAQMPVLNHDRYPDLSKASLSTPSLAITLLIFLAKALPKAAAASLLPPCLILFFNSVSSR